LGFKGLGVKFHPFFSWKDILIGVGRFFFMFFVVFFVPYLFLDRDMFFERNPIVTPEHIVPE
jgi:quinol-cytochrome oxidoreductase complex cytochrome b subunit